ncbi:MULTISPECIES: dUTP diphosphatase [Rhizobium]|uniref:dUTP diphosphatase n=1 Tax=Rhizobium TaxID=379 RepID=UPI00287F82EB|nr:MULTISPECIES: dUTP diphosphatase [unclassified Rhizobium]
MANDIRIGVALINEHARLPEFKTSGSVGADLFAAFEGSSITLDPGTRATVPTGIGLQLPDGIEAQIRPRSGLAAKHGISVLNSPGTVDSDYRGEISVVLINTSDTAFTISSGDRIAQIIIAPVIRPLFERVNELDPTSRGEKGFGSTGV